MQETFESSKFQLPKSNVLNLSKKLVTVLSKDQLVELMGEIALNLANSNNREFNNKPLIDDNIFINLSEFADTRKHFSANQSSRKGQLSTKSQSNPKLNEHSKQPILKRSAQKIIAKQCGSGKYAIPDESYSDYDKTLDDVYLNSQDNSVRFDHEPLSQCNSQMTLCSSVNYNNTVTETSVLNNKHQFAIGRVIPNDDYPSFDSMTQSYSGSSDNNGQCNSKDFPLTNLEIHQNIIREIEPAGAEGDLDTCSFFYPADKEKNAVPLLNDPIVSKNITFKDDSDDSQWNQAPSFQLNTMYDSFRPSDTDSFCERLSPIQIRSKTPLSILKREVSASTSKLMGSFKNIPNTMRESESPLPPINRSLSMISVNRPNNRSKQNLSSRSNSQMHRSCNSLKSVKFGSSYPLITTTRPQSQNSLYRLKQSPTELLNNRLQQPWICSYVRCSHLNSSNRSTCSKCFNQRWHVHGRFIRDTLCPNCGFINYKTRINCKKCFEYFPEKENLLKSKPKMKTSCTSMSINSMVFKPCMR